MPKLCRKDVLTVHVFYSNLAFSYKMTDNMAEAIKYFTDSFREGNKSGLDHRFCGTSFLRLKQYDKAIESFTHGIKLGDEDSYRERSKAYKLIGKYDMALQDITQAIRLSPNSHYLLADRAQIYILLSNFKSAVEDYTTVIKSSTPKHPDAYMWERSRTYLLLGHYASAAADIKTVAKTPKDEADNAYQLDEIEDIKKQGNTTPHCFLMSLLLSYCVYRSIELGSAIESPSI